MKTHFSISYTFSLIFLLFIITLHHTATPTSAHSLSLDFIRSSCNATLYPTRCFSSLSRYADIIRPDPAQLALLAIRVSLARAHRTASHFSNMTQRADHLGLGPRAASALRDCASTLEAAVDKMRGSLKQMHQLGAGAAAGGAQSVRFQLSNVQTWMSAALTNEDTCEDGFEGVDDGPVKADVCGRVAAVKELTSNALSLVNSFAATVGL